MHISSFVLKTAVALWLTIGSTQAMAARHTAASTEQGDTVATWRGVAVSVDAAGIVQMAVSDYGQYEAALRVNLRDRYFPVVEVGYGKADTENIVTGMSYKTKAPYARIGIDFNVMKNKHDIYRIYAGFRYGYTKFEYDVAATDVTDPVWGDKVEYDVAGVKANCHWLEGVVGVDAKIWGPLRLGWSFRYKRRLMHDDGTTGNTWYVPGYGKQGGTRLGGTFNIAIEL